MSMHERKEGMREEFGYRDAPTLKGQLSYFFDFFFSTDINSRAYKCATCLTFQKTGLTFQNDRRSTFSNFFEC